MTDSVRERVGGPTRRPAEEEPGLVRVVAAAAELDVVQRRRAPYRERNDFLLNATTRGFSDFDLFFGRSRFR